ncbi:MAG: hypothetical protein Q4G16_03985 [Cruoricaptor ignavus]|nr:hypothetical protein [Cruoricaptor ignavus]
MKSIFNNTIFKTLFVAILSLSLFSCRNNDAPEDTHDHEEIEKATLTITEKGTDNVQVITYIGGETDKDLTLENGKTYTAILDFFHKHDDHYHSMLDEIIEEKDEHFVTYEFAGVAATVTRATDDVTRTDNNKLGIRTEWAISSVPTVARVDIKLYHGATSVNSNSPSATNQLGTANGSSDLNMKITIK